MCQILRLLHHLHILTRHVRQQQVQLYATFVVLLLCIHIMALLYAIRAKYSLDEMPKLDRLVNVKHISFILWIYLGTTQM